jgi:hypothetical protein
MGYCIFLLESEIFIATGSEVPLFSAIEKLTQADRVERHGRAYSFIDYDKCVRATDLHSALMAWRWATDTDELGNITSLDFIGEKLGDEEVLFEAIAPFVQDGSYIQMAGDDGRIWRWLFQSGKLFSQEGSISFGMPEPVTVS